MYAPVYVGKDDRAILIWKHELEQHDSDNEDVDSEDYTPEVFMSTGDEAIPPDDADLGANVVSKPWKKSIIEPDDVQVPPGILPFFSRFMPMMFIKYMKILDQAFPFSRVVKYIVIYMCRRN